LPLRIFFLLALVYLRHQPLNTLLLQAAVVAVAIVAAAAVLAVIEPQQDLLFLLVLQ
jgi:hypothetical protein